MTTNTDTLVRIGTLAGIFAALTSPLQFALADTTVDPAKNPHCLNLSEVDHTEVLDGQTILFYMHGKKIWKNTLPYKCPSLGYEKAFSHKTSTNNYCSVDIITVIYSAGGMQEGASCGLGPFTPYTPPPKPDKKKPVAPISSR